MKQGSHFALALAIAGLAFAGAQPAVAQKKDKAAKAEAGPQPELSKPFRAAIGAAQLALKAGNAADGEAKLGAAEPLAQMPDEKFYVGAMRFELGKLKNDNAILRKAINEMIASNSKLMNNRGELLFNSGRLAYQANDFPDATARFTEAESVGFKSIDLHLQLAEANFKANQLPSGLAQVDKAIALEKSLGKKPPEAWYRRAVSVAYKANMSADVGKWSRAQVLAYPTAENWRTALITYRDSARLEGQQSLDLFRLMRKTKSLAGERDFYEYASLATDRALPGEAKAMVEEGFASGAVSKSSRAVNEILTLATGKIASDRASLNASEKQASGAANGRVAKGTADGFLAYGEDAKAIALYQLALQKGGVDADEVNLRLGIAQARIGQGDLARQAFAKVTGPRAETARFWTLWLDTSMPAPAPAA